MEFQIWSRPCEVNVSRFLFFIHNFEFSLRHFEHIRNKDAKKAESLRGELLQHLKDLNKVVNESMSLLNYLPEIAEQFGITGSIGGAVLKPMVSRAQVTYFCLNWDGVLLYPCLILCFTYVTEFLWHFLKFHGDSENTIFSS